VALQISHIVPRSGRDMTARCIDLVEEARRVGVDVAFDMPHAAVRLHPSEEPAAGLGAGGRDGDAVRARLRDPAARGRMASHPTLITALGDWSRVLLVQSRVNAALNFVSLAEIAARRGKAPIEAAFDLLLEEVEDLLQPMVVLQSYDEEVLRLAYSHPACMIGSDSDHAGAGRAAGLETFHGAYTWAS
jgi:N-acyl-D-aspartate/D-glutamate deacylase